MHVTIIGTGNMARGVGSRVLAGGHDVTVVGKDAERAEEAAGELAGAGEVDTAIAGEPLTGDVIVLAVYARRRAEPGRRRPAGAGVRARGARAAPHHAPGHARAEFGSAVKLIS